ncbi:hypothetical protein [Flavobacterium sp. ACAM 123]|jgi:hypothetical protein|uniref:hypothetical protein n=1 Tax=Flavobacterium sp. ACAM 123 TaxID=1189620 RepID=UPI0003146E8F|nr:hypothetical protein [Flavobacterium sp. ACAM 123]
MKKLSFLTAAFIMMSLVSCGEKKDSKKNDKELTAAEGSKAVTVEVSDVDRYEGKIVKSTTGQWYLIKEGCRWRTNSIEATDNYLKKLPVGPDYVDENVAVEILQQFPEVGELLPGLNFKKDERSIAQ